MSDITKDTERVNWISREEVFRLITAVTILSPIISAPGNILLSGLKCSLTPYTLYISLIIKMACHVMM